VVASQAGDNEKSQEVFVYGAFMRIVVMPGMRPELLDYLRWDAQVARDREPGTLRFDVWEVEQEPDVVYVYEAYRDMQAFEAHKKNEPYKKWAEVERRTMQRVTDVIPYTHSTASNMD
jgi:(4S)-4-hydroxy-5-phosphonooxypentane-2,3-dione isomerase